MVRISKIELTTGKMKRDFTIEHAERLLGMVNNGGWGIANKSKYEFKDGSISIKKK